MMQQPNIINQFLPGRVGRGRPDNLTAKIIVIHTQAGDGDPWGYFQTVDADSTIWNSKDGKLYRYLQDTDIPWTNGDWTEPINHKNPILDGLWRQGIDSNAVSLTVENEGNQTFTDAQYTSLAQLVAYWCDKWKIPCDRNHICGHYEIGPHKFCPGPFDFNRLINAANTLLQGTPQPPASNQFDSINLLTGQPERLTINEPFFSYWQAHGGIAQLGLPVTPEVAASRFNLGFNGSVQYFERARAEFHDVDQKIYLGRVGAELVTLTK